MTFLTVAGNSTSFLGSKALHSIPIENRSFLGRWTCDPGVALLATSLGGGRFRNSTELDSSKRLTCSHFSKRNMAALSRYPANPGGSTDSCSCRGSSEPMGMRFALRRVTLLFGKRKVFQWIV